MEKRTRTGDGKGVGTAYAFFDSSASPQQIEDIEVGMMKEDIRMGCGGKLEISLSEVKNMSEEDNSELYDFVQTNQIYATFPSNCRSQMKDAKPIRMSDLKYVLQVEKPGRTDVDAANYAGNLMNAVYQKYGQRKPFNVAVVYRNPQDGYLDFKQD